MNSVYLQYKRQLKYLAVILVKLFKKHPTLSQDDYHEYGNIQGTNDHAYGNIQGTNDHEYGNIQGTNDHEYGNIQGTNDHEYGNIQGTNDHEYGNMGDHKRLRGHNVTLTS
ncbi:hypothetical protein CEXT_487361 [Caerostris extrusa]|uniref:Uncharacterized protein n=1 Tax=Caerostris extrusa TaxID=172846 RepID=A0AAV4X563_CAEEX|nr:hypothetical protein CEXT_487361 [Caerostris extrusa]